MKNVDIEFMIQEAAVACETVSRQAYGRRKQAAEEILSRYQENGYKWDMDSKAKVDFVHDCALGASSSPAYLDCTLFYLRDSNLYPEFPSDSGCVIPMVDCDTAEKARQRGFHLTFPNGRALFRLDPFLFYGNDCDLFDVQIGDESAKFFYALISRNALSPITENGNANLSHFLYDPPQPNEAEDIYDRAIKYAANIKPNLLLGHCDASSGAPVVNSRGEVVFGNVRANVLNYIFKVPSFHTQAEKYRKALDEWLLRENVRVFDYSSLYSDRNKEILLHNRMSYIPSSDKVLVRVLVGNDMHTLSDEEVIRLGRLSKETKRVPNRKAKSVRHIEPLERQELGSVCGVTSEPTMRELVGELTTFRRFRYIENKKAWDYVLTTYIEPLMFHARQEDWEKYKKPVEQIVKWFARSVSKANAYGKQLTFNDWTKRARTVERFLDEFELEMPESEQRELDGFDDVEAVILRKMQRSIDKPDYNEDINCGGVVTEKTGRVIRRYDQELEICHWVIPAHAIRHIKKRHPDILADGCDSFKEILMGISDPSIVNSGLSIPGVSLALERKRGNSRLVLIFKLHEDAECERLALKTGYLKGRGIHDVESRPAGDVRNVVPGEPLDANLEEILVL